MSRKLALFDGGVGALTFLSAQLGINRRKRVTSYPAGPYA